MKPIMESKRLYTLGYLGHTLDEIVAMANKLNGFVVDARFSPRSRLPQYEKSAFGTALGHRYLHVAALGNVNYRDSDKPIVIADFEAGFVQVLRAMREKKQWPMLMCACRDAHLCHRTVLAKRFKDYGYDCFEVNWTSLKPVEPEPEQLNLL